MNDGRNQDGCSYSMFRGGEIHKFRNRLLLTKSRRRDKGQKVMMKADQAWAMSRRKKKRTRNERVTDFCTSTFPKVTEISNISTSSGLAERASKRASTSSMP